MNVRPVARFLGLEVQNTFKREQDSFLLCLFGFARIK